MPSISSPGTRPAGDIDIILGSRSDPSRIEYSSTSNSSPISVISQSTRNDRENGT